MDSAQELLTPDELAKRLKVSVRTVYREQADGKLPGRTVRGKLRFYWPDVVKALPAAPVTRMHGVGGGPGMDLVALLKQRVRPWRGHHSNKAVGR